jgi:hypothetical protein
MAGLIRNVSSMVDTHNISHASSFSSLCAFGHYLYFQSFPSHIFSQVVYAEESIPCNLLEPSMTVFARLIILRLRNHGTL